MFYLKNWQDTTNNRINGNVKVKQHDRNCSDLEKKLLRIQMCSKNPPVKNVCSIITEGKKLKVFLMFRVYLCDIKDDEANI